MNPAATNINDAIDYVLATVERWAHLGRRRYVNAAEDIGHVPLNGPDAYLHARFAPLSGEEVSRISAAIGRPLPISFSDLLKRTNGLFLFYPGLSIYGLQEPFGRDPERPLPYPVINPNTIGRPRGTAADVVFIGGHSADGRKVWMRSGREEVYVSPRFSAADDDLIAMVKPADHADDRG